jgi:hypothetical protein
VRERGDCTASTPLGCWPGGEVGGESEVRDIFRNDRSLGELDGCRPGLDDREVDDDACGLARADVVGESSFGGKGGKYGLSGLDRIELLSDAWLASLTGVWLSRSLSS